MFKELDGATSSILTEALKRCCAAVQSTDSALWLADKNHLHPVMGYGPHSARFIGEYYHPLTDGLISMVYASGQSFCENNIASNPHHSSTLDQKLEIQTDAMIVMPVVASGEICGVITCVNSSPVHHSKSTDESQIFSSADMAELEYTAAIVGRILDSADFQNTL